jgi:putative peptidoglycan lipid II flippase
MEPSFFSRGNTKTPMKIAILCLINNLILNYVFYILEMGFVGIILASVFSSYLNLTLLISNLIRQKLFYFEKDFVKKLISILIPSLVMAFTLYLLKQYFLIQNFNKFFELAMMILLGLIIYFITSYFSGSLKIITQIVKLKRKKNDNIPA